MTILFVFTCVMNVRYQSIQSFVTSFCPFRNANLFTDHGISGLPIRAEWERFERTHVVQGVLASSAYQNLPTYGSHVLQRFTKETYGSFTFSSLRIDREQHVPDSSKHSLYLIKLFNFSDLEGHCGRNQQPDGSISRSPLSSPPPSTPPPPPRAPQQHTTHRHTQRQRH